MQKLLAQHIKYLFNYKMVRATYVDAGSVTCQQIGKEYNQIVKGCAQILTAFEQRVLRDGIPREEKLNNETLRGWVFNSADQGVLIFSISTTENQSSHLNQSILKLISESLLSKFIQFTLYEALDSKNEKLNHALKAVQCKNEEISALVSFQRLEIAKKTRDIRSKNQELRKIIRLNAHEVREPLSRIMGLINLIKQSKPQLGIQELLLLEEASHDLDAVLRQVIQHTETKLKPQLR